MPSLVSTHHHSLRPDHRTILLRDIDSDAGEGARAAMEQARHDVAASSGYGVYIIALQDLIKIAVTVEVWDASVDEAPSEAWNGPVTLRLDCPTGQMMVGDEMGDVIDGIDPPRGPGRYTVAVYHQGRDRIRDLGQQVIGALGLSDGDEQAEALGREYEGVEAYLLRLWWSEELPDDESADDD